MEQFNSLKSEYELREENLKIEHGKEMMQVYFDWAEQKKIIDKRIEELTKENKRLNNLIELGMSKTMEKN
jgi:hypothetical protein